MALKEMHEDGLTCLAGLDCELLLANQLTDSHENRFVKAIKRLGE